MDDPTGWVDSSARMADSLGCSYGLAATAQRRRLRMTGASLHVRSGARFGSEDSCYGLEASRQFGSLQTTIWQEVLRPTSSLKISSLRRGLQRQYLNILTDMVLGRTTAPEDARTIAWYELKQLRATLDPVLAQTDKLDISTTAHLEEVSDRITKVLEAQILTR